MILVSRVNSRKIIILSNDFKAVDRKTLQKKSSTAFGLLHTSTNVKVTCPSDIVCKVRDQIRLQ